MKYIYSRYTTKCANCSSSDLSWRRVSLYTAYLSAGGRGGAGMPGVFAADPVADVTVGSVFLLVGGERVEEEDPRYQSI